MRKVASIAGWVPILRSLQWGRNMRVAESQDHRRAPRHRNPSMGPQHESCGKRRVAQGAGVMGLPSMGPQHESCGKPHDHAGLRPRHVPSMGPQHESCGKYVEPLAFYDGGSDLQWGRNMRVAERRSCLGGRFLGVILQWGRNMRVAERRARRAERTKARRLQWGRNMRVAESLNTFVEPT